MISTVVIVGGGTAGWLTAAILAAEFRRGLPPRQKVILVESPEVATIGVGEGTWPTMRSTLKRIGISEKEFLVRCNASFKQGSKFIGWRSGEDHDVYQHPFTMPSIANIETLLTVWKDSFPSYPFSTIANLQASLVDAGCAPKQITTPEYAGQLNYGYHLDAGKFAELLKEHCVTKLQVEYIVDHVGSVESAEDGGIAALLTRGQQRIVGDLFIDCSGQASLLIDGHFNVPRINQSKYSINDTALAVQLPYLREADPISSATLATAQQSGWIWDIGLQNRRGIGYVYSSSHATREKAEKELQDYIGLTHPEQNLHELQPRQIKFTAGYRKQFWIKNCVAIGMSAGFIEPLEASAIVMVELAANMLRDEMAAPKDLMPFLAERFNEAFSYRWKRIIAFLRMHYVLSQRRDTDYWRDVTSGIDMPDELCNLLSLWKHRAPSFRDFTHTEEIFPATSYQYVLYGMSPRYTDGCCTSADEFKAALEKLTLEQKSLEKYQTGLPKNRQLLMQLKRFDFIKL